MIENKTTIKKNQIKEKVAITSVLANTLLAGGKIIIGLIAHSSAILAEGLHSLMDIFSSIIGYMGIKLAQKPEDKEHPYGHYKFEVIAGLFITLFLFGTGIGIIYEAYQKALAPSQMKLPLLAFGIMFISVLVNETMSRLEIYFGKKENSIVLLANGTHDRVDVYTSLAIFVGLFLTPYWIYLDPFLAFLVGCYIIKESVSLAKETMGSLLDVSADSTIEEQIKTIAKKENISITSLKTQKKGSSNTANLEITLPSSLKVSEATTISENLRKTLIQKVPNLIYVAIQIKSHDVETNFYQPAFGQGFGWQRQGRFKNSQKEAQGQGPDGLCVCPQCGYKTPHQTGTPCSTLECPQCHLNLERK